MKPDWESKCGTIRLYNADCRDVLPGLEVKADLLLTDPPYGIVNDFGVNTGNGMRTMAFEWDSPDITDVVLAALDVAAGKTHRKSAAIVFCGGDQFGAVLDLVRKAGFTAKPAVWAKQCPPPAGKGNWYPSAFEFAVYGYKTGAWFGDEDTKRSNVFWYENDLIWFDSYRHGQPGKVNHPTQKPLELIARMVQAACPPEGVVLDCFMGSGTTAVACARYGRRFIGIEKENSDERPYFDICVSRVEEELQRDRLFTFTPPTPNQTTMFEDVQT